MRARAVLFTGEWQVALGEAEIPEPGPGEVLVEAVYTCISPGTELRCLSGRQHGAPEWPFIPGYAVAGRVHTVGPGCRVAAGDRVICAGTARSDRNRLWGGHVEFNLQAESSLTPVPVGVDLQSAAVARLASIAYHGARLSRPAAHETVAVIGLGAIGQLAARVHAVSGARVVAADRSEGRCATARSAGIEAFTPTEDLVVGFHERIPGGADIVIEATGSPALARLAIELARDQPYGDVPVPGARLLIQATYPDDFTLPYMPAFRKELSILLPRDRQPRDQSAALDLAARGRLHLRDLISIVCDPAEAPGIYASLREQPGDLLTALFQWKPDSQ